MSPYFAIVLFANWAALSGAYSDWYIGNMKTADVTFGKLWAVVALVILGLFMAGCSAEAEPRRSDTVESIHNLPVEAPAEGYEVGQQAPAFTLRLADDTTITSQEIIESGRPTFLFFWATT